MFDILKAEKKEIIRKLFPNVIIKKEVDDAKVMYNDDSDTEDDEEVINNGLFQMGEVPSSSSTRRSL